MGKLLGGEVNKCDRRSMVEVNSQSKNKANSFQNYLRNLPFGILMEMLSGKYLKDLPELQIQKIRIFLLLRTQSLNSMDYSFTQR